jgi:hypothetical protein
MTSIMLFEPSFRVDSESYISPTWKIKLDAQLENSVGLLDAQPPTEPKIVG